MASDRITPRTLKGFRDYLPEAMARREHLIDTAREVYRSYGFSPIDTPALEFESVHRRQFGEAFGEVFYPDHRDYSPARIWASAGMLSFSS